MKIFKPKVTDFNNDITNCLNVNKYNEFNSQLLGLDNINQKSVSIDAIAAIFDLKGFTNFCKQIEPHLSVPLFLSEFLEWLFEELKKEMTLKRYEDCVELYCPLPFLVKFMGDGVLILWEVNDKLDIINDNIIVSCSNICNNYTKKFLPKIQKQVVDAPEKLRCGLARGTVYSIGNGKDYVGSCINMAARLEKLPGLTFAFNKRGFKIDSDTFFKKKFIIKKMSIRGIGDKELVGILKDEFNNLKALEKKIYKEP